MKRLIIVTGSSRGIGAAIATEFNMLYQNDTHLVLIARDLSKLNEVEEKLVASSGGNNKATTIRTDFSVLTNVEAYYKLFKDNLPSEENLKNFDELICVYNHGTLEFGNISLIAQESLRRKFEINLFSVWSMLGAINLLIPSEVIEKQFHVNITSGYAQKAVANWSGMCCARASRDMLFNCFALENPSFRILNYEPGIVMTDMLQQAVDNTPDFKEQSYMDSIRPKDTANKLVSIVIEDSFKSGSRIKYKK